MAVFYSCESVGWPGNQAAPCDVRTVAELGLEDPDGQSWARVWGPGAGCWLVTFLPCDLFLSAILSSFAHVWALAWWGQNQKLPGLWRLRDHTVTSAAACFILLVKAKSQGQLSGGEEKPTHPQLGRIHRDTGEGRAKWAALLQVSSGTTTFPP